MSYKEGMNLIALFRSSQLKVFSALLIDIAAGLLLGTVTVKNIWVLLGNIFLAIICLPSFAKSSDRQIERWIGGYP